LRSQARAKGGRRKLGAVRGYQALVVVVVAGILQQRPAQGDAASCKSYLVFRLGRLRGIPGCTVAGAPPSSDSFSDSAMIRSVRVFKNEPSMQV